LIKLFKNSPFRFFFLSGIIYLFWFLTYEFYIIPKTNLDEKVISNIVDISEMILRFFSHETYASKDDLNMQMIGVDGAHPVWIGRPCNGIAVMAIFTIFILVFPGKVKNKVWFIPSGLLIIHIVNVLRVCALASISYYKPNYLYFNHTYTFTILIYGIIFLLWMVWVNRFSKS
jgi:exosortase family protein XrtF